MQDAVLPANSSGLEYEHDKPWQSSVLLKLETHEYLLFHDFVQNLSLWVCFSLHMFRAITKFSFRWTFLTPKGHLVQLFRIKLYVMALY